jgi:DNA-binding NtrC family response regulator
VVRARSCGARLRSPRKRSLGEVEREHIQFVLDSTGHNRSQAARILGIGPTTLWRKLKAYERTAKKRPRSRASER